jgi:hypothetical protein
MELFGGKVGMIKLNERVEMFDSKLICHLSVLLDVEMRRGQIFEMKSTYNVSEYIRLLKDINFIIEISKLAIQVVL